MLCDLCTLCGKNYLIFNGAPSKAHQGRAMKRMTRDVRTRRPSPTFKISFPPTAETQLGPSGKVNAQPMLPALIALAPGPRHRPLAKMNFKTNL